MSRWAAVGSAAQLVATVAVEAGIAPSDMHLAADPTLSATDRPTGFPEVVVQVSHPGHRRRLARLLGLPHPETHYLSPGVRVQTYTGSYAGVRVQVVGPIPDPLATDAVVPARRPTSEAS